MRSLRLDASPHLAHWAQLPQALEETPLPSHTLRLHYSWEKSLCQGRQSPGAGGRGLEWGCARKIPEAKSLVNDGGLGKETLMNSSQSPGFPLPRAQPGEHSLQVPVFLWPCAWGHVPQDI